MSERFEIQSLILPATPHVDVVHDYCRSPTLRRTTQEERNLGNMASEAGDIQDHMKTYSCHEGTKLRERFPFRRETDK